MTERARDLAQLYTAKELAVRVLQTETRAAMLHSQLRIATDALREIARDGRHPWNLEACRNFARGALARIGGSA
jgi:hypothetical protein